MTDYSVLIARLEEGSGEDRELDRDVYELVKKGRTERASHEVIAARYTGSLDAALAFAESQLPGHPWQLVRAADDYLFSLLATTRAEHRDAPRAVLIAVLRAKDTP